MRDPWLEKKIETTKKFGVTTIFGLAFTLAGLAPKEINTNVF